jgi:hypothetical protein
MAKKKLNLKDKLSINSPYKSREKEIAERISNNEKLLKLLNVVVKKEKKIKKDETKD